MKFIDYNFRTYSITFRKKLQIYNFSGGKEKEWNLEINKYIKSFWLPVLVGLKYGQILKIFLNNVFTLKL